MVNEYSNESPPSHYRTVQMVRPYPSKPPPTEDLIYLTLSEIRDREPETSLAGWVYYDHFLRFLWTIGPKNAALIKTLRFSGVIKFHTCDKDALHDPVILIGMSAEGMPDKYEDALIEIPEYIKAIETLKELEVFSSGSFVDSIELVNGTIDYIKKRAEVGLDGNALRRRNEKKLSESKLSGFGLTVLKLR
ncbi:hypothetical protein BDZ45DRAFT_751570 [Acephala macrosclerotiorum]|nr:hypothetical protein BDZ45DRAFT_751570 [Acephala macrosclerotiorum]